MKRILVICIGALGGVALTAVATMTALAWHGDSIASYADCRQEVLVVTGTDQANGYHFGVGHGTLVFGNGATYPWTFAYAPVPPVIEYTISNGTPL